MLSREIVADGYRRLCTAFGRKGKDDVIDIWWEALRSRRVTGEAYAGAVDGIIEGEGSFPPLKIVLEYAGTYRGRERGEPRLYGRPMRDVLEDIEEHRDPLAFVEAPGFWKDETERFTYLNAAEEIAAEKMPDSERIRLIAEKATGKLMPKEPVQSMPDSEVPF